MSRSYLAFVFRAGVWVGTCLLVLCKPVAAQSLSLRHGEQNYRALRVDEAPSIDGDLSDAAWRGAQVIDQLVQQVPVQGGAPSQRTEVRIVYDDTALYVGFYAYESNPSMITRTMLRYRWDSVWQLDDVVRFSIDTFHDHRRGYAFSFNAFGTKQDAQLDNGSWLPNWDEVWDVRTQVHADGWTAEVRVPFRVIRFPEGTREQVWGLQIERHIKRLNEIDQWAVAPPNFGLSRLDYAGHMEGISSIEPRRNAQVVPYVAAGRGRSAGRAPETSRDIGADAKFALGPALALDLTYNTNFAQVEVDDQQVNLTRFPLFFPEKREFFLESSQLFNVGLGQEVQAFFSRRIGLAAGVPLSLLGGARLTGKVGAFDVGVLSTQTDASTGGPTENQSAGRARWNVGSRSYLGGIVTSVASDVRSSQTVATDGRVWLGQYLQADGFVSVVNDRRASSHPIAYSGALVYEQDRLGATARRTRVDGDFEPALGFVRRRGFVLNEAKLRRGWRVNRPWARKVDLSGELRYFSNMEGRLDTRETVLALSNELTSGDLVRLAFEGTFDRLDETDDAFVINPRQGIVVPAGDYTFRRWLASYQGFAGRSFTADVEVQGGAFYGGDRVATTLTGTWRPSPYLILSGDYQLNDVDLPQGTFATHLQRARVTVPLTARLVTDGFVQWNGLTRELNTQVRLHLIYGRDSNFFIVYTDHQADADGRLAGKNRALQTKLTYRWYW